MSSIYYSDRGEPLVYTGLPPKEKPVLTVENYLKWYSLYLVMPSGLVEKLPFNAYSPLQTESPVYFWNDHTIHPKAYPIICDAMNFEYDSGTHEVIIGRYVLDVCDGKLNGMQVDE